MTPLQFTLAEARSVLADNFAPWVLATGIVVEAVAKDTAILRIPYSDHLSRVGGTMSGQTIAAGADTAMVIALAAAMGGFKPVATVELSVNYMRPIAGADAVLTAKVIRLGRSLAFCTTEVHAAGSDKPSAFATATFAMPSG